MIANAEGDIEAAVNYLQLAVNDEDALLYGEPPEWTVPVRQEFGAMLLEANRASEAEAVFRADLAMFPENSWSLAGLSNALQAQGKQAESDALAARLYNIAATGVAHLAH
jgi:predicted Zn-dependent protease